MIQQLEDKLGSLKNRQIGILGLAFKADNDDLRDSLSFKIKKLLELKMANVLVSDIYVSGTLSLEEFLHQAEGVILGVPHTEYITRVPSCPYVDCWGVWPRLNG